MAHKIFGRITQLIHGSQNLDHSEETLLYAPIIYRFQFIKTENLVPDKARGFLLYEVVLREMFQYDSFH